MQADRFAAPFARRERQSAAEALHGGLHDCKAQSATVFGRTYPTEEPVSYFLPIIVRNAGTPVHHDNAEVLIQSLHRYLDSTIRRCYGNGILDHVAKRRCQKDGITFFYHGARIRQTYCDAFFRGAAGQIIHDIVQNRRRHCQLATAPWRD